MPASPQVVCSAVTSVGHGRQPAHSLCQCWSHLRAVQWHTKLRTIRRAGEGKEDVVHHVLLMYHVCTVILCMTNSFVRCQWVSLQLLSLKDAAEYATP